MSEPVLPIRNFIPNLVLKFRYFAFDIPDLLQLGIGVDPGLGFVRVIEKREQAKIFFVGDRIILVGMALGTLKGKSQCGFPKAINPVKDPFDPKFFRNDGSLLIDHSISHKS